MALQNFAVTPASYQLGRRANAEEWNSITKISTGATAVKFGVPVMPSTLDGSAVKWTATNRLLGITEAASTLPHPGDEYQQYDTMAVCERGVIGVLLGENVADGQAAGFDGTSWYVADTAAPAVPGCVFEVTGLAGQIGLVRIRATG